MMKTEIPTNGERQVVQATEHRRATATPDFEQTTRSDRSALMMRKEEVMNTTIQASDGKSRVLIIDNNPKFTRGASLLLQHTHHYIVCEENDPHRALETARSFKPDLVVVDLIMPQADGLEVAMQLEADWALHRVPMFS